MFFLIDSKHSWWFARHVYLLNRMRKLRVDQTLNVLILLIFCLYKHNNPFMFSLLYERVSTCPFSNFQQCSCRNFYISKFNRKWSNSCTLTGTKIRSNWPGNCRFCQTKNFQIQCLPIRHRFYRESSLSRKILMPCSKTIHFAAVRLNKNSCKIGISLRNVFQ